MKFENPFASNKKPMKIAEITSYIKEVLEGTFSTICIEGEISNFRPSSSGHLYFTLKDETSTIAAVMFKGKSRYLPFTPKDGLLVHATGTISVYEARGTYQIIIDSMEAAGAGDILKVLEERKRKLAEEGLFDQDRKKSLPYFPLTVGVVTSPTGAAVRDIVQVISRRNSKISIIVLPALVQGEEAAANIEEQIRRANAFSMAEVLIVGRGGGSLEDLLPFSDERVVRAIADSKIPVISAVGHEIDFSLADFASDVRAPTPSAAAELVCPLEKDIYEEIEDAREKLLTNIQNRVRQARLMTAQFSKETMELQFYRIAQPFLQRFDDAKENLLFSIKEKIKDQRLQIERMRNAIEGSSPKVLLERGYSIVIDTETGKTITQVSELQKGKNLTIYPAKGSFKATVTEVHDEEI